MLKFKAALSAHSFLPEIRLMHLLPFPMYRDVTFLEMPDSRLQSWHELWASFCNGSCSANTEGGVGSSHFSTLKLFQLLNLWILEWRSCGFCPILGYPIVVSFISWFIFLSLSGWWFFQHSVAQSQEKMIFSPCLPVSRHLFIVLIEIGTLDSQGFLGSCGSSCLHAYSAFVPLGNNCEELIHYHLAWPL